MSVFDPHNLRTLRPWLLEHVCPFWLQRITDPAGGFAEEIDALGSPIGRSRRTTLVREKEPAGLIWLNRAQRRFIDLPSYLAVLSTQPIDDVADPTLRRRQRIGIDANLKPVGIDIDIDAGGGRFRDALKRLKIDEGLFIENGRAVTFLTPTIFRAPIPLPATAPSGPYDVDILLIVGGAMLARQTTNFEVIKSGFEQTVVTAAQNRSLAYGLGVAGLALVFGWVASVIFRRD
jgi:uncharacterized protein (TIGR02186 family)